MAVTTRKTAIGGLGFSDPKEDSWTKLSNLIICVIDGTWLKCSKDYAVIFAKHGDKVFQP